jgi:hypothetical protein
MGDETFLFLHQAKKIPYRIPTAYTLLIFHHQVQLKTLIFYRAHGLIDAELSAILRPTKKINQRISL